MPGGTSKGRRRLSQPKLRGGWRELRQGWLWAVCAGPGRDGSGRVLAGAESSRRVWLVTQGSAQLQEAGKGRVPSPGSHPGWERDAESEECGGFHMLMAARCFSGTGFWRKEGKG